jgi:type I restriction enzyme S subunit
MDVKPGYKRTEVGVIPENWDVKCLGSVLSKGRLGGNYANQDAEAELPLMKMGNLARGYFDLSKVQFITPGVRPEPIHQLVLGDVLFNTRNTLDLVGKVAIWRNELPIAYYNSNLMRLEFDPDQVTSTEYANYSLNTEGVVCRLRALATGTTSVAAIYTRDLMKLLVLVPPPPEQLAIAEALGDVDALLAGLGRLIAKKRDLKQAAMQQLLTPPGAGQAGQTRLPGFTGAWEVKTFGDLFTFSGGYSASRDQLSSAGHCYLHYGDIHGSTKTTIDAQADYQNIPKLDIPLRRVAAKSLLADGDVVFVDASEDDEGTSRHVVVVNKEGRPFIAGLHTIVAKGKTDELTHAYRRYCFQTSAIRQQFLFYAVGTKVSGISKKNIARLKIPIPPLPEQTAIAEVLSDMDAELAALEQRREKTAALKQGMMQELLTGRIRLL